MTAGLVRGLIRRAKYRRRKKQMSKPKDKGYVFEEHINYCKRLYARCKDDPNALEDWKGRMRTAGFRQAQEANYSGKDAEQLIQEVINEYENEHPSGS